LSGAPIIASAVTGASEVAKLKNSKGTVRKIKGWQIRLESTLDPGGLQLSRNR
jgi:hypothetical protein